MHDAMLKVKVSICIEPDGEGYYAYCPELKGVHIHGNTFDIAKRDAELAIIAIIHSILEYGDPLPDCVEITKGTQNAKILHQLEIPFPYEIPKEYLEPA